MNRMGQRRPRLLYLAFYFPPSRASGVYRARATANLLAEQGWDVTVFAAPLPFLYDTIGSVDEKLMDTVDPRITVVRPNLNTYTWQTDLRDFSGLRKRFPHLAHTLYARGQRHVFPERYVSWGRSSLFRALRMHARRRFDVVLATGNPYVSFGVAWLFHRLTRTPYVIDYRDAWTLDQFTEGPRFDDDHGVWRWERRVLERAAGSAFVNEAQREWHARRYPVAADRMITITNGWDADTLTGTPEPPPAARAARDGERGPRFSFVGTFTEEQPIEEMMEGFARAREFPEMAEAELRLFGYFGFFKAAPAALRARFAAGSGPVDEEGDERLLAPGVRHFGPVSKTTVAEVYRETDVLVFLTGGGRYITSGKIFEYMATGRPILSVHAPGSAAEEILRGYPLWFNPGGLDPADIASSMVEAAKAAAGLDQRQVDAARAYAEPFERSVALEPLVRRLTELAGRGPGVAAGGEGPAGG
jgi:glycosyltransferase involved in cell wall biosynthesis